MGLYVSFGRLIEVKTCKDYIDSSGFFVPTKFEGKLVIEIGTHLYY